MASLDDNTNNTIKQHDASETTKDDEALNNKVDDGAAAAGHVAAVAPSCHGDPNFAIVCAFLQKFAGKLNITYPNFAELQSMLENTDERKY